MMNRANAIAIRISTWVSSMREQNGASMVEYAILISLIAVVALIAVAVFGRAVSSEFSDISGSVATAGN